MPRTILAFLLLAAFWVCGVTGAELPQAARGPVDFARDVQPILRERCWGCHGAEKQKSNYRLDRRADAIKGGDSGDAAIVVGKGAESPMVRFTAGLDEDMLMPPKKSGKPRLTADEIGVLRAWIDDGAKWPEDGSVVRADPRAWWSLKPIVKPAVPSPGGLPAGWAANPVDRFIFSKLAEKGLAPSPEADRRTLCRRLYFDLTGLPPGPEAMDAFAADASPDATAKLTDRLLASPAYGERWARHWLDVVHYGESDGFEYDKMRPTAWRYRDWVIQALNADLPFNEFARLQIAGDVLKPDAPEAVAATGFLVAGAHDGLMPNGEIMRAIMRQDELEDIVSVVSQTFLGLTVNCARCHDHKFDPILQKDYYRLASALAGVKRGERNLPPR